MATIKEMRPDGAGHSMRPNIPTVMEFILDETGSMTSCKAATITGYNTFIKEQRDQDGQGFFTLTKFDSSGLKTPFVDLDLSMVIPMTTETFQPGALTNLRDAIGTRVRSVEERIANWTVKPNVLIIVMTDGGDNTSKEYSTPQFRDLIKAHEAEGWTFVCLAACANGVTIAGELGFQPGNVKQFEAVDMEENLSTLSNSTTVYRASRANGDTTSSAHYFA